MTSTISRFITIARNYSLVFNSWFLIPKKSEFYKGFLFFLALFNFQDTFSLSLTLRAALILYHIQFRLSTPFSKFFKLFFWIRYFRSRFVTSILYHMSSALSTPFLKKVSTASLTRSLVRQLYYYITYLPSCQSFFSFFIFCTIHPTWFEL